MYIWGGWRAKFACCALTRSMRPTTKTRKSPRAQLAEVVAALDLRVKFKPFTRCMACNGALEVVAKEVVAERLPPQIR